jgi:hypothetical protein
MRLFRLPLAKQYVVSNAGVTIFLLDAMPVMLRHFESRPVARTLPAATAVERLLWLSLSLVPT